MVGRGCSSLLLALIFLGDARAEALDQLIVLGSALPSEEPVGVTVIQRQRLASYGAASLARVLADVPAVHVGGNAGRGSVNSIYLRGADPNMTQIQINGVPVNDPSNSRGGAFDIGLLSAQLVERIEILPVSASAQYGSQALAGVINIITLSGDTAMAAIAMDSEGGHGISAATGGDHWQLALFQQQPGEQVAGSDFRSQGALYQHRWQPGQGNRLSLDLRLQQTDARAYPDDSGGALYAAAAALERREPRQGQLRLAYDHNLANGWQSSYKLSYFYHQEDVQTPAIPPGLRDPVGFPAIVSANEFRQARAAVSLSSAAGQPHRFVLGLEAEQESGANDGLLDFSVFQLPASFDLNRNTLSAFAEWRWAASEKVTMSLGLRADHDAADISPRLHIEKRFSDGVHQMFLNWGEGYKRPSFYALGQPLIGNPALLDETAASLELGYRYQAGPWQLELAVFDSEYRNLIDFEPGPPPRLVNRERVDIRGLDFKAELHLTDRWRLAAYHALVDSQLPGAGAELLDRPRQRSGVGLSWEIQPRWRLRLDGRYVGSRLASSIPTGDRRLDSYINLDAALQWQGNGRWGLLFNLDNLTDRHYQDSIGNPVTGLLFRLLVNYRL